MKKKAGTGPAFCFADPEATAFGIRLRVTAAPDARAASFSG
ncbi:hypothetical protein [Burkholderia anthina]